MKKKLAVALVVMIAVFAASFTMMADAAEDYKVIKRAAKNKSAASEVIWFKLLVTDKKTKKNTVKITVPVTVLDLLADSLEDNIKIKGEKEIDFKKILKALRKHGPMAMIEVDDDDQLIKVWLE